jgi:hypothetical protein
VLLPVTDALHSLSPSTTPINVPLSSAVALFTPGAAPAAGSGQVSAPPAETISAIVLGGDPTNPVYVALGSTASATHYHFVLPANGLIVLAQGTGVGLAWRGLVSTYNPSASAACSIGVAIL